MKRVLLIAAPTAVADWLRDFPPHAAAMSDSFGVARRICAKVAKPDRNRVSFSRV
ncbi:MAG TPA: hypothetical protein VGH79_03385 [Gaiellaceae bacterium]